MEAGADGYCFKDVSREEILKAISVVLSGSVTFLERRGTPLTKDGQTLVRAVAALYSGPTLTQRIFDGPFVNCGRTAAFLKRTSRSEPDQRLSSGSNIAT